MVIAVTDPEPVAAGSVAAGSVAGGAHPGTPPAQPVRLPVSARPGPDAPASLVRASIPPLPVVPTSPRPAAPWVWRPLAGPALLSRLRNTGRRRPAADPDLVAGLRRLLDDAAAPVKGAPVVLTGDDVADLVACPVHASGRSHRPGPPEPGPALACGALVAAAFRQLAVTGSVADPVADGLAGLELDDFQAPLAAWIRELPGPEARELRVEVERQVDGLRRRWPALAPSWMPRVGLPLRIPVAGGAVLLTGRIDLAIGRPARDEASVALVDVVAGARRPAHAERRAWLALLETLRSGVPPFAAATYFARTGELDTDPVDATFLVVAAHRVARGVASVTGGSVRGTPPVSEGCPECLRDALSGGRPGRGPSGGGRGPR